MRMSAILPFAFGVSLLGACATGGNPAFAELDEPHAVLRELLQGDIDSTHQRTRLVRIDGQAVAGTRRTFLLTPGTHTLAFELDVDAWKEFDVGPRASDPDPGRLYADLNEKSIEVDLAADTLYTFGARVEDDRYVDWEPFVVEREEND